MVGDVPDIEVTGEATHGREMLEWVKKGGFDIATSPDLSVNTDRKYPQSQHFSENGSVVHSRPGTLGRSSLLDGCPTRPALRRSSPRV